MLNKLFLPAAAAVLFAASAYGQTAPSTSQTRAVRVKPARVQKPAPAPTQKLPALSTKLPNTVHEGGNKYLGRDPDPDIRYQIMKDETMHKGNNY